MCVHVYREVTTDVLFGNFLKSSIVSYLRMHAKVHVYYIVTGLLFGSHNIEHNK